MADEKYLDQGGLGHYSSLLKTYIDDELESKADSGSVPTKTSDLTNDSGYITSSDILQSDWNENDSTSSTYIANRTHYKTSIGNHLIINMSSYIGDMTTGTYTFSEISDATYTNKSSKYYSLWSNGYNFDDLDSTQTATVTIGDTVYSLSGYHNGETGYNEKMYFYSTDVLVYIPSYWNGDDPIVEIYTNDSIISSGDSVIVDLPTVEEQFEYTKLLDSNYLDGVLIQRGTGLYSEIFNYTGRNTASGEASHAEGWNTTASGSESHAEGRNTTASGYQSHAEGGFTTASGGRSHAEGSGTTASGYQSHAEGSGTVASSDNQHVQGKYNVEDTSGTYADIVGNGTDKRNRSNAYTLDWSGNGVYSGKLTVGANPTASMDVVTKDYVDSELPTKTSDLTNDSNFVTDASYVHTDNNYTSTEKTKLSSIAENAQVNIIETVKMNGTALNVTNKAVDVETSFRVNLTYDDGGVMVTDKTYEEIIDAYNKGKFIYLDAFGEVILNLISANAQEVAFANALNNGASNLSALIQTIYLNKNGTITAYSSSLSDIITPISTQVSTNTSDISRLKKDVGNIVGSYSISISSNVITLTGADGSTSSVTLPVYDGGVSS